MKDDTRTGIRWPAYYRPGNSPVHVKNERFIHAPPEVVWAWLIRARLWPNWYSNASNLTFLAGGGPDDLALGTCFRWRTFWIMVQSNVLEFEPSARIAWDAKGMGVAAYHGWILTASEGGCRVVTEECQHGWGARLLHFFMPRRMSKKHHAWLAGLAKQAALGLPAPRPS